MLKSGYCGTNDFIPGRLYYGVGVWRNVWVYLGRSSNKEFVWFFVGNDNSLLHNPTVSYILDTLNRTGFEQCMAMKALKRVKPLEDIFSDKDDYNYIYYTVEQLARNKVRIVDIQNLTQEQLDYIANKCRNKKK